MKRNWVPSKATVFIIFFLLCFIPTNVFFIDGIDSIVLLIATPLLLMFSVIKYPNCLRNRDITLYFIWFFWVVFTSITAINSSVSFAYLKTLAGGVMMSLIYYLLAHNEKLLPYLYAVFIVILAAEIYYTNTAFVGYDLGVDIRANDQKLNANSLAYMTFYSICGFYFIGEMVENKTMNKVFRILFFLMVPVAIFVSLITASRQVLPTSLGAWFLLFYQRYMRHMKKSNVFIIILIAIAGYFVYNKMFEPYYADSMLATRTESTDATDTRFLVLKEALQVSSEHLLVGVGPANFVRLSKYHIFTHNSYMEMLVSSGLMGLFLYVAIIYRFLKKQIKRYRATNDRTFFSLFLVGLIWAIYNFLYVFYAGVYLIPFLFLMMGHSDYRYRTLRLQTYQLEKQ